MARKGIAQAQQILPPSRDPEAGARGRVAERELARSEDLHYSRRMKIGARNQIVGKVADVKKGSLMCQVKVRIDQPIQLSSVMTLDSLEELGVKPGDEVMVVVKAVSVLLVRP